MTTTEDTPRPVSSAALQEKALRALGGLPPFSPILNKVLASLTGQDVSFAKLGDLIEKDSVLAGNILHMVNSALYGRRGTINSVRHALSLLGINKLRNAVLGMSLTRMWRHVRPPISWSMARFNLHSAATAVFCDSLAQRLPVAYPEGAFIAGLLHDVGRLLIAIGLPEQFERIAERQQRYGGPAAENEIAVLGFAHPELSAAALAFWNLPEPIQAAVRQHHTPAERGPGEIPLSLVVAAADQYVHSMGVTISLEASGQHPIASQDFSALDGLRMDPNHADAVVAEFQAEFEAMMPFFK